MKVLITGSQGFIGRNLKNALAARRRDVEIQAFNRGTGEAELQRMTAECSFVFHLAGVNRPKDPSEFMSGNIGLTKKLLELLERSQNAAPVLFASSVQAEQQNPYGESKRAAEQLIREHACRTGSRALIYRLPNIFGKDSRPNYNSAIATFCHNISRGLPIEVREPARLMRLAYIDDVVDEFIRALSNSPAAAGEFCTVPVIHEAKLGDIASQIRRFQEDFNAGIASDQEAPLQRKLYATWLSFLPRKSWIRALNMKTDQRGSFTEFLRMGGRGQVSVNVAKPGITKGGHWHETKSEKFLVVQGNARIRLRKIGEKDIVSFDVSGSALQTVEIPVGWTHDITNIGEGDLITVMWASEPFDQENPDTYFEPVVP